MVSQRMLQLGTARSVIRELFEYGRQRAAEVGAENVFDFSLGNPSVPAPVEVNETAIRLLREQADTIHCYTSAPGDPAAIAAAQAMLTTRIKGCAKDIRDKYIDPPNTTDFGIMFLPFEGLYAEVVRLGLVEVLQRQYKVNIAGPTTFAALLNSLQMGFRTLAIQKRSSEVWSVLGAVKTEFATFEDVLAAAQKRIEQTGAELDKLVGVRTRKINSRLRSVSVLPAEESARLLDDGADAE